MLEEAFMIYDGRRRRGVGWRWLLPVSAVSVAAIVLTQFATGARPISYASALSSSGPRYYVTVYASGKQLRSQVRNSTSGQVIGTVSLPITLRAGATWQVAGTADDQHFAVAVQMYGTSALTVIAISIVRPSHPVVGKHWSLKRAGNVFQSLALSPNGAVAVIGFASFTQMTGTITALTLSNGRARSWSGSKAPGYLTGDLSFVSSTTLAVPWVHYLSHTKAVLTGVRMVNVTKAGGSLLSTRLVAFKRPQALMASAIVADGGKMIIASACQPAGGSKMTAQVEDLSGTSGSLVRVLHAQTVKFSGPSARRGIESMALLTCPVLSVDSTGQHVLIEAFTFGRLDSTRFRQLTKDSGPFVAAW